MRNHQHGEIVQLCILVLSLGTAATDAGSDPTITLQPVQPTTSPPSTYPPGTTIIGQEITLGSVPARVWLEIHITGWNPNTLRGAQAKIDASDADLDGGGYFQPLASCGNSSSSVFTATASCSGDTSCDAAIGASENCTFGQASACSPRPCHYPPGDNICQAGFQNLCHPKWIATGLEYISAVDDCGINYRLGVAIYPDSLQTDTTVSYLGTLALEIPFGAKGTFEIDSWRMKRS